MAGESDRLSGMPDMLVRLYDLPDSAPAVSAVAQLGVRIVRAAPECREALLALVAEHFAVWQGEVELAFADPLSRCFVAMEGNQVVGFAAYDVACRNFFGPTGVREDYRGRGIGKALLLVTLAAQAEQGYAYAVIGGVGPQEFYRDCVDAQLIEGSSPGIYVSADD